MSTEVEIWSVVDDYGFPIEHGGNIYYVYGEAKGTYRINYGNHLREVFCSIDDAEQEDDGIECIEFDCWTNEILDGNDEPVEDFKFTDKEYDEWSVHMQELLDMEVLR